MLKICEKSSVLALRTHTVQMVSQGCESSVWGKESGEEHSPYKNEGVRYGLPESAPWGNLSVGSK